MRSFLHNSVVPRLSCIIPRLPSYVSTLRLPYYSFCVSLQFWTHRLLINTQAVACLAGGMLIVCLCRFAQISCVSWCNSACEYARNSLKCQHFLPYHASLDSRVLGRHAFSSSTTVLSFAWVAHISMASRWTLRLSLALLVIPSLRTLPFSTLSSRHILLCGAPCGVPFSVANQHWLLQDYIQRASQVYISLYFWFLSNLYFWFLSNWFLWNSARWSLTHDWSHFGLDRLYTVDCLVRLWSHILLLCSFGRNCSTVQLKWFELFEFETKGFLQNTM